MKSVFLLYKNRVWMGKTRIAPNALKIEQKSKKKKKLRLFFGIFKPCVFLRGTIFFFGYFLCDHFLLPGGSSWRFQFATFRLVNQKKF